MEHGAWSIEYGIWSAQRDERDGRSGETEIGSQIREKDREKLVHCGLKGQTE
jgi:hypothetical protein